VGWAFCDGRILPIAENEALFQLVGTTYGGDGQQTFGLPDLRGRIPIHQGSNQDNYVMGQISGSETVTLTSGQLPQHTHGAQCSNGGPNANGNPGAAQISPSGAFWDKWSGSGFIGSADSSMSLGTVGSAGGSQPHDNMPPFLVVNFVIALEGIFPSQT
jgi:microcystin-dependent protein